jgi:glycosyltransferase involved in cell wall biosynthesis
VSEANPAIQFGFSSARGDAEPLNSEAQDGRAAVIARAPIAISAVIPTLNESAQIEATVDALSWADQVIVVDGGSTDDTVARAKSAGACVITLLGSTIGGQRNAGIELARNQWILAIDADERVDAILREEIARVVESSGGPSAFGFRFRNEYLGRELKHGPWGRDWHVRLFTRDQRYSSTKVHEGLEVRGGEEAGNLRGAMIHRPYRDIAHHAAKIMKYARWGAEDLRSKGRRPSVWALVARPAWRFVRDYFIYSGWRDGIQGFIAAVLSSFAAFLKYAFLFDQGGSKSV